MIKVYVNNEWLLTFDNEQQLDNWYQSQDNDYLMQNWFEFEYTNE